MNDLPLPLVLAIDGIRANTIGGIQAVFEDPVGAIRSLALCMFAAIICGGMNAYSTYHMCMESGIAYCGTRYAVDVTFAAAGAVKLRPHRPPPPIKASPPRAPRNALSHACSFSGATVVLMADGSSKAIADIELGDMVLAEDPETGERGARKVTHLWIHQDQITDLELEDGSRVSTTEDHPFWNHTDAEWQRADALDPDDLLLSADGDLLAVNGMDPTSARTTTAYNLHIEDIHTYFVVIGDEEALVHNKCVNLPSWKRLDLDMDHISSGHMPGGSRVSPNKGIFENMTDSQVQRAIRDAYNSGKRTQTQVDPYGATRVRIQGQGGGRTIEMWVNTTTNVVETAYPL